VPVGPDVAAARVAAGRSLDDVASATRIRSSVLARIEDDDFSQCGGDVYARGHLRAIGHALNVDPEPWIAQYDSEHAWQVPSPVEVLDHEEVLGARPRPNWSAAMAVVLVAVVGVGVWSALRSSGDDAGEGPTTEIAQGPLPSTSAPVEPPPPIDAEDEAVAVVDDVTLALSAAEGRSWVSVSDGGGEVLFQGILEPGDARTFTDSEELSLVVGNGGAVELTVNGEDLGSPGGQGEVVRLSFGPGDPNSG
jgi:cytoskeletal protein RodZ